MGLKYHPPNKKENSYCLVNGRPQLVSHIGLYNFAWCGRDINTIPYTILSILPTKFSRLKRKIRNQKNIKELIYEFRVKGYNL